jgi:alkaline phosphatase D
VFYSCIKPNWPYVPFQDHTAIPGAADLADRIAQDKLEFLMFMGDFIYSDVPHPVTSRAAYAKKYRQVFASKDYRRVYERTPTLYIYDDHELSNDYAGEGNDTNPVWQLSSPAYESYIGQGNPDSPKHGAHYYSFDYGDVAFFVWDTRRYRTRNEATDDESKSMLGPEQKEIFLNWLAQVNQTSTFKFVVSSVPFMTLWGKFRLTTSIIES